MIEFTAWCASEDTDVGIHSLRVLTSKPQEIAVDRAAVAAAIPVHYASGEHISRVFARLGKAGATTVEGIQADIDLASAPGFRERLLAQGQARAMIWRDGGLPPNAPAFSAQLS